MHKLPASIVDNSRRCALFGLLLALPAGCHSNREQLPPESASSSAATNAVRVTVEPVSARAVERKVGIVGTLRGYEEISLGAKVAGRVSRIYHDVADRIAPGEMLLEIDPKDFELNLEQARKSLQVDLAKLGFSELPGDKVDLTRVPTVVQARVRLDNAQLRLERIRSLVAQKATSQEELSDRTAEYRVAQAEYDNQLMLARAGIATIQVRQEAVALAEQQLRDTKVRVPAPSQPIPGVESKPRYAITGRSVSEGSYIMVGDTLFNLVLDQSLKLRAPVPERKSGDVRLGQPVRVYASAFPYPFNGEVTRINPAIDPTTRTFEVEMLVPNKQGELKPGGFAKAEIISGVDEHAITVPLEALVYFAGVTKIFLVEEGHAKDVHVTLGVQSTDWVEIASPRIAADAVVVTSGQTAIADGTPVVVRAGGQNQAAETHSTTPAQRMAHEAPP